MNHRSIMTALLLCFYSFSYSQVNVATPEQFRQFNSTTTCIVNHPNPFTFFNAYIKDAVEKHWNITPYRFIDEHEFEKLMTNTGLSFVVFSEATYTERRERFNLDVLNIVLGNRGRGLDDLPDLGSIPLSYADDEEDKYLYKLPAFIKLIQYQIRQIQTRNITRIQDLMDFHNSFQAEIKNKELWLLAEELAEEVNSLEKIRVIYPYPMRIVTKDELEDAIGRGEDIIFCHLVAPYERTQSGRVWKFVIGAKDGKVYAAESNVISSVADIVLNQNDFAAFGR